MSLRKRQITGTLTDSFGNAIVAGVISFKPTKPLGFTETHIITDAVLRTATDASGNWSMGLWADQDSLLPINYIVNFPIVNGGEPQPNYTCELSIVEGDGTPALYSQFLVSPVTYPPPITPAP